jgi:hypothetical protein
MVTGLFTVYWEYTMQRNTISMLIIVNEQFEKTGQNTDGVKKNVGIRISVKSHIVWAIFMLM